MYHRYFGMKHRPFTATPQTGACFPASVQEEALATLQYAITQGRGIALLTGAPGTGKTLVCHRLTANLEPAFTTAMITNTNMPTIKGLLQAILYDLSLPFHGREEQELRLTLTDFILGKYAGGGRTVLVIDEAHNLAVPLLEELRMFSNLEGESDKLLQIVLAGHPRMLQLMRSPELETLSQRVGARAVLTPLIDEETVAYIQYQLESAGVAWDRVFSYEAMCAVHELTGGVPRLISQLSDHALLRAYVMELRRVDRATVEEARIDLEQSTEHRRAESLDTQRATRNVAPELALDRASQPNLESQETAETGETFVACTEFEGTLATLQVSTDYLPAESEPLNAAVDKSCGGRSPGARPDSTRTNSAFIDEEVVIDPYARMDAARTASISVFQSQAPSQRDPMTSTPAKAPTEQQRGPETAEPTLPLNESATKAMTGTVALTDTSLPEALFVDSGDNVAVHEVGAGVTDRANESTEPPILIIENRQQRIGNHIARVDTPQPSGHENRGYRRLFTHARKS